jgi:hypothetical protein
MKHHKRSTSPSIRTVSQITPRWQQQIQYLVTGAPL